MRMSQSTLRHPEKARNPVRASPARPDWIRARAPGPGAFLQTQTVLRRNRLRTVCEEAACPNIGECWAKQHATVMILGDVCTRSCAFCNVATGKPAPLDPFEPTNVAQAVRELKLRHVVITSVDRDDLPDGGAGAFAETIRAVRRANPGTTIEVLTPDFLRKENALEEVIAAAPDVFNHNLETVPRLYLQVRAGARYFHSLHLLHRAKQLAPHIFTKSGLMLGLGEGREEVLQVMDDLRVAQVDFLTLGQYLQPSPKHYPVQSFPHPEVFESYRRIALGKGFFMVSSSPLTRSSYHAGEDFAQLKKAREQRLAAKRKN